MDFLRQLKEKTSPADKPVVVLDLDAAEVKGAQVSYSSGRCELLNFACERVEAQTKEAAGEALLKVIDKAALKSKEVRLAVGGGAIIVRYIQLPKMTKEDLGQAMDFEGEKFIPFKREEVYFDFQILEKEYRFDKNKMSILLVAAKRDFIDRQVALIKEVNREVSLIDVDSFSLINTFLVYGPAAPEKTIGLLNIGAGRTNINIIKNNLPIFTRDISVGGDDLTGAIKNKFKVSQPEAEKLKFEPGDFEKEMAEVIRPVLENMFREIRLSFDYFENQVERGIDLVYLTGKSSGLAGLDKYFSDKLGLTVRRWNPSQSIGAGAEISPQELKAEGAGLGVCLGLAVRQL